MRDVTLCLLLEDGAVWLGMKKRGFGEGKWNGFGGKVSEGETIAEAALRELEEEAGVRVQEAHLDKVGEIAFTFDGKPDWNQRVHIFITRTWEGDPTESEEMRPLRFLHEEIPFGEMWIDDPYWIPRALSGERFEGAFTFSRDGSKILEYTLDRAEQ